MSYLVAGGLGFIGPTFIHCRVPARPDDVFINGDCRSGAENPPSTANLEACQSYHLVRRDFGTATEARALADEICSDVGVHFAEESNVGQSVRGSESSLRSNVVTMFDLPEPVRKIRSDRRTDVRSHRVSAYEDSGSFGRSVSFTEATAGHDFRCENDSSRWTQSQYGVESAGATT